MRDNTTTDRGQAYTLEGFISAMIVLMALLFALQSVVIVPTTGGLADRTVEAQLEQETQDALTVSATSGGDSDLSTLVRYWNEDDGTFHDADADGEDFYYDVSNESAFYDDFVLGEVLMDRFTERGQSYNVELIYQDEQGEFDDENNIPLVSQGESEALTASYTVTLLESDTLTAPNGEETELREAHDCGGGEDCYPIPPATDHPGDGGSEIYNVVEVRVTIW